MYKLFLALRYLSRKWIALFAVMSVWLCVSMVLIVFSVMDGFLENIKEHSRGLLSDIIVDNSSLQGFPYYTEFTDHLQRNLGAEIELITPVIYNYGIMRVSDTNFTKPVRVVGVHLDEYCRINTFKASLYYDKYYADTTTLGELPVPLAGLDGAGRPILPAEYEAAFAAYTRAHPDDADLARLHPDISSPHGVGRFEQLYGQPGYAGSPLPGLIIGTDVVYQRERDGNYDRVLNRGCEIILTLLPLTARGTIVQDPISVAMRHVDDSRTRVYEIDNICVYADFVLMQRLLGMDAQERVDGTFTRPRTSQLLVRLRPGYDATKVRARIEEAWTQFCLGLVDELSIEDAKLLARVGVETWQERQRPFIAAVEKEKVLVTVLFGIISLVAVVMIGVVFYMIVLQKTRDIGVIKSLGATRSGVAAIFITYGAAVGVVGGLLGVVCAAFFVHYINEIQDLLAALNPELQVWSPDVYTFDRIPNVVKPYAALMVFAAAVFTSMVGALVPAVKAAIIWPVQALRYE